MDRTEFLEKLFRMYPQIFNEYNTSDWCDAYESALSDVNIDYDHLFRVMIMNWEDMRKAPSPRWFRINHTASIKHDDRCAAVVHMEDIKKDSVPPPEHIKEKMELLRQKMSMGK